MSEKELANLTTNFCNITTTFSGIGNIVLDVNSIVLDALLSYNLSIKDAPYQTIYLHFNYIVQNLRKYQLKDIIFMHEPTGEIYFDLALTILNDGSFREYRDMDRLLEETRIALALVSTERKGLGDFLRALGLYVGYLDVIMFEVPFIFTVISSPRHGGVKSIESASTDVCTRVSTSTDVCTRVTTSTDVCTSVCTEVQPPTLPNQSQAINWNEMEEEFFNLNQDWKYNKIEPVEESLISELLQNNLDSSKKKKYFDGRIYRGARESLHEAPVWVNSEFPQHSKAPYDYFDHLSIKDYPPPPILNLSSVDSVDAPKATNGTTVASLGSAVAGLDSVGTTLTPANTAWSGKDLDLLMPPIPEKIPLKHLANIARSAMSLYDGKFHFSTITKASETPKKLTGKMLKIVQENEERLRKEREKQDNAWLKSFYAEYVKLLSIKEKKEKLENSVVKSDYVNRRLLLLKIELYSDIWSLEMRNEEVDESVLVPLYLNCLKYLEEYGSLLLTGELEFVIGKLIEGRFEATAMEMMHKLGIELDLKFSEGANSAPNDLDLYFQLKYAGDHLKRTLGTRKDKRVPFDPDKWQVELLDAVDAGKSAIVSAPTSSGKTFICFYAIEKVLRSSDTDMVVFCLPTKALVNQVSADIYARFTPKNVKVSLQGTLMADHCNEPFNCQVLITVPSMLESLLNSKDSSSIKHIIIDEAHKINDPELGLRIERVIHMAKCPLLLLSATLGNLEGFYRWFSEIESKKGRESVLVCHGERYCELKTYVFSSQGGTGQGESISSSTSSTGSSTNSSTPGTGSSTPSASSSTTTGTSTTPGAGTTPSTTPNATPKLIPLNGMFPYSFSHLRDFGFGNDIHFLPKELLDIYLYIYTILDPPHKKLIKNLAPKKFFKSNIICKADIKEYQNHLLGTFRNWVSNGTLGEKQVEEIHSLLTSEAHKAFTGEETQDDYIVNNIMSLLDTLKEEDALPVIIFNTDRDFVTELAKRVFEKLEARDIKKKKDKQLELLKKEAKRSRDAEKTKNSWIEDSIAAEQMIEPESRDLRFTYLDRTSRLSDHDVREELHEVRNVPKVIVEMVYRGIGIHHAAMSRKYRSAIEILFRKKHVRVLFATETLALGINMPCRTVVFAGDSLQLDPMNYKQMSGRAGRRGYDILGNVVFFGVSKNRIQNLMISMLPEIRGGYTYSNTSLVGFSIEESLLSKPLVVGGVRGSAGTGHGAVADDPTVETPIVDSELLPTLMNLSLTPPLGSTACTPLGPTACTTPSAPLGPTVPNTPQLTLNLFDSFNSRSQLVSFQKKIYPHIYPSNYLWDLYISNRSHDPAIFVFGLLLHQNIIIWSPSEFFNLLAHLFELRFVLPDSDSVLPPLNPSLQKAIMGINTAYINHASSFFPPPIKSLQRMSSKPLFYLKSFLYSSPLKKNSYILDFFTHGSVPKIRKKNGISPGDLWQSLNSISMFLKSLLSFLDTHFGSSDERLKKLRVIYAEFDKKFQQIFA